LSGEVTEQFKTVVDPSIAIAIKNEKWISAIRRPRRPDRLARAEQVKQDSARHVSKQEPVSLQIHHNRRGEERIRASVKETEAAGREAAVCVRSGPNGDPSVTFSTARNADYT
jgi:hypothetical protein